LKLIDDGRWSINATRLTDDSATCSDERFDGRGELTRDEGELEAKGPHEIDKRRDARINAPGLELLHCHSREPCFRCRLGLAQLAGSASAS
jgi:hypothetical protein